MSDTLPNGLIAKRFNVPVFFMKIVVQQRYPATFGTVIRFMDLLEFGIQDNIRGSIGLEFVDDLDLDVIPVLQISIKF